ncbi:MAG: protein phosphatase 2C domain-containing protein [Anaerolineaceae bacterium]|nr:protein phosphatase 2C domain-containing protein [Anaerolineaceae bacterium]
MTPQTIFLAQTGETAITHIALPQGRLRYAYARSRECQAGGDPGQDALAIQVDAERVVFALCDGVSLSFMGDWAARFLSQQLVNWLIGLVDGRKGALGIQEIQAALALRLSALTALATRQIKAHPLPDDLSPMLRSVLEEKRGMGSESMFICGWLDFVSRGMLLAWMGDSRLRLWQRSEECTEQAFGDAFQTRERWSTQKGALGQPHVWMGNLEATTRLAAYSDGLAILDGKMDGPYADSTLDELIQSVGEMPNSDDISYFEVILAAA